ncbi:SHOCT domain-containing protein [Pseudonocardia aurantiaca]|uniref:SHOCT domain-containing protein n=1 Tax=Pseudonocardia aurantiaca TaxID=75290 RepID=A0ABW4FL78_9PSEU
MPLWDVVVSIFWFMILFTWIWLLIAIFSDMFRDHELSGWGKALWTLFLVVLPWLGALVYLIVRGKSMNERARAQAQRNEQAFGQYVRETAGTSTSTADELAKLADLRDRGTLTPEEFERAKAKVLGQEPAAAAAGRHADQRPVSATP